MRYPITSCHDQTPPQTMHSPGDAQPGTVVVGTAHACMRRSPKHAEQELHCSGIPVVEARKPAAGNCRAACPPTVCNPGAAVSAFRRARPGLQQPLLPRDVYAAGDCSAVAQFHVPTARPGPAARGAEAMRGGGSRRFLSAPLSEGLPRDEPRPSRTSKGWRLRGIRTGWLSPMADGAVRP